MHPNPVKKKKILLSAKDDAILTPSEFLRKYTNLSKRPESNKMSKVVQFLTPES